MYIFLFQYFYPSVLPGEPYSSNRTEKESCHSRAEMSWYQMAQVENTSDPVTAFFVSTWT